MALIGAVLILAVAYHPLQWKFFPPGGPPMDTTHWKTYCSGRFLMDIPPNATITDTYGEIWGVQPVWREDLTPETARKEAEAEMEKLKKTTNEKTASSMFIEIFDLPNGGIAVVRWDKPYSDVFIAFQCYFVTPEQRVFMYTYESSPGKKERAQKRMLEFASTLRARDEWEIPTESGFCFQGGFSAYTGEWRSERSGFGIELPEFPGLTIGLDVWGIGEDGTTLFQESNAAKITLAAVTPGVNVFRYGEVMIGGIKAEEVAMTEAPEEINQGKSYYFKLQAPSHKDRLDRPQLHLAMNNQLHLYDGKKPFTSDAEALSLWDAISRSIRLRPGAI